MAYKFVSIEIEDRVAWLRLERPPRNLLNIAMMEEINDALVTARKKKETQLVVVRGADGVFCEGLDYKEHGPKRVRRLIQVFMRIFETMRMMQLISIAAVEGAAEGSGFELALGCNLIVAAEGARFGLPQIKYGTIPPVAAAVLPRIAPRRRAMEWVLMGNAIEPQMLEQYGVLNRLFPAKSFEKQLSAFIAELAEKSGPVLRLARRAQFEAYYTNFPDALSSIQTLYLNELLALHDATEGPKALREGRDPAWKHS
jgi:enoyl-CoA hydratase/carnithine racemase